MFEGVKMVGNEPAEVMALYEKIEAGVRGLGVIGINGPVLVGKLARALEESGGDKALLRVFAHLGLDTAEWKFGAVEFAYWYIAPVLRLGVAIFILDTWQYFLHRGMHESKWLYSSPPSLPLTDPSRD